MDVMDYGTHPSDYLHRAKAAFEVGKGESLFYAALELRTGIEKRMKDYVQESIYISKAKKKEWRIANLGKTIDHHFQFSRKNRFRPNDEFFQLQVFDNQHKELIVEFNYVPVSKRAQEIAMKLGDYLHANDRQVLMDEPWWAVFKDLIEEGILELEHCLRGNLLGAPLMNYSTGHVEMVIEHSGEEHINVLRKAISDQENKSIYVNYLDRMAMKQHSVAQHALSDKPCNKSILKLSLDMSFMRPSDEEFKNRQTLGESTAKTAEGQEYMEQINSLLGQTLHKALLMSFPSTNASVENNGLYQFIANISKDGYLLNPAIKPSTKASEHFVRVFVANSILPIPPETGRIKEGYPITIPIMVTN